MCSGRPLLSRREVPNLGGAQLLLVEQLGAEEQQASVVVKKKTATRLPGVAGCPWTSGFFSASEIPDLELKKLELAIQKQMGTEKKKQPHSL